MKKLYLYLCPECGWQLIAQGKFKAKCIHCHRKMIEGYDVSPEAIAKFQKDVKQLSDVVYTFSKMFTSSIMGIAKIIKKI